MRFEVEKHGRLYFARPLTATTHVSIAIIQTRLLFLCPIADFPQVVVIPTYVDTFAGIMDTIGTKVQRARIEVDNEEKEVMSYSSRTHLWFLW